ncbi:MAG TPA: lytic transglycosylase domain-containing protein [Pyrinomonadaceae bacterium]|jgi:hypothetical protein
MKYALTLAALLLFAAPPADAQSTQMSLRELEPIFQEASAETGVDVRLLRVVGWIESRYKPRALSYKNGKPCAYGLMQLIPATAARFGVTDIYDPRQNVLGGARYLRQLLKLFDGNVTLALAAYNAGEGNVIKYGRAVPPFRETRGYVASGLALLARTGPAPAFAPAPAPKPLPAGANTAVETAKVAAPPAPPPTTSFVRRPPAAAAAAAEVMPSSSSVMPVSFVRRAPARLP